MRIQNSARLGKPVDIRRLNLFAAVEAAKKYLGYKPSVLFDEGLLKTVNWYKIMHM